MSKFDKTTGFLETYSGEAFYPLEPDIDMIELRDVAMAKSRLCRYNGHTKRFFSVLEHECVMADYVMSQPWATARDGLTALHHDDAEYAIGDMVRPVKQHMDIFKEIEAKIDETVSRRFGTIYPFPDWLKEYDGRIIADERAQVVNPSANVWGSDTLEPLGVKFWNVMGRYQWFVRYQWLRRHYALCEQVGRDIYNDYFRIDKG